MRRGQPSRLGWRNETPRQFRPRSGVPQGFRPPRPHTPNLSGAPRYPHQYNQYQPRLPFRPRPPFGSPVHSDYNRSQHTGNRFHKDGHSSNHPYHHHRSQHYNQSKSSYTNMHSHKDRYSGNDNEYIHKTSNIRNSDVQQQFYDQNSSVNPSDKYVSYITHNVANDLKRYQLHEREISMSNEKEAFPKHSMQDYYDQSGHRPHSSDYYTSNTTPNDDSETFSRSVDDTVNIIKERLMNKQDPNQSIPISSNISHDVTDNLSTGRMIDYQEKTKYTEASKKKQLKNKYNTINLNCNKLKNKIVHQLFKMEKDAIHKLMDNPTSSSKFEYAINSLITESQNSFNRHMRSAAEKSLFGSSSHFQYNENDTIYEDTFMKQMQCVLDPEDTIILSDLKPIVMAELNKVLQLDELDQKDGIPDDDEILQMASEKVYYGDTAPNESCGSEFSLKSDASNEHSSNEFCSSSLHDTKRKQDHHYFIERIKQFESEIINRPTENKIIHNYESIFDSKANDIQVSNIPPDYNRERRISSEKRRNSINIKDEIDNKSTSHISNFPLFDSNADALSEDEDPFAELDKQYHVDVDHNFIKVDDPLIPERQVTPTNNRTTTDYCLSDNLTEDLNIAIKQETQETLRENISEDYSGKSNKLTQNILHNEKVDNTNDKRYSVSKSFKFTDTTINSANIRKRPIDEQPSHRKEKRKKSANNTENNTESNKPILNKNIIMNVNDCVSKNKEKCDPNSIVNLFFSEGDTNKDVKKELKSAHLVDISYSDKYVKRKDTPKKMKEKVSNSNKKSHNSSNISIHSTHSADESHTPMKLENKSKFKTFDMFQEKPRKMQLHQAHRKTTTSTDMNVILSPTKLDNKQENIKPSQKQKCEKVLKRTVSTQIIKKLVTKETQTLEIKFHAGNKKAKATQTENIATESSDVKSTDAFERMKEIDVEIQVLLHEKFKLYNSLKSKDLCPTTMPTLGMTVVNVTSFDETKDENDVTEESVIDNFTELSEQDLENLALESVENSDTVLKLAEQVTPRRHILTRQRRQSESESARKKTNITPRVTRKKRLCAKKAKSPNISIIEQIISDDRPLEDIISLNALESSPIKTRSKRNPKGRSQKKKTISSDLLSCIKPCSVLLIRSDLHNLLLNIENKDEPVSTTKLATDNEIYVETSTINTLESVYMDYKDVSMEKNELEQIPVIHNEIHFHDDMMGISEDIVIEDDKTIDAEDISENHSLLISEDAVVDNSCSKACDINISSDNIVQPIGCKMYDYSVDEELRNDSVVVTGNGDAVLAIECTDNHFLAACLDGNVYYFSGDGQLLTTLRGSNFAVTCMSIVEEKHGTIVYTGSLDSRIRYYDLQSGMEKGPECNVLSPIQTMDRAWDTIFVGTRTGFVLQFECKNNILIPVSTIKFSEQSILALRALKEGPRKVLLVAARSENVTIKDAQTGLLLRTLVGPKMTVYTLLYENGKVYCGTSSHQIQCFDYASGLHAGEHEGGKGAVCLLASGGLLFAGCYDGCVYVFRSGDREPIAQLRGPSVMLLSLAIVSSKIIAGYKDRSLYIWKIPMNILQEMIL